MRDPLSAVRLPTVSVFERRRNMRAPRWSSRRDAQHGRREARRREASVSILSSTVPPEEEGQPRDRIEADEISRAERASRSRDQAAVT
jgi:hypothetical protein